MQIIQIFWKYIIITKLKVGFVEYMLPNTMLKLDLEAIIFQLHQFNDVGILTIPPHLKNKKK